MVDQGWISQNAPNFSGEADIEALGDLDLLKPEPLLLLQKLRNLAGVPIWILCGAEPRKGQHGEGLAIDFAVLPKGDSEQIRVSRSCAEAARIYYLAKSMHPPGLGIYPQGKSSPFPFFHIDCRRDQIARWVGYPEIVDGKRTGGLVYQKTNEPELLRILATGIEIGRHITRGRR